MFGASLDWGFEQAGASARGYDCWVAAGTSPTPDACPSVATNQWTWTDSYRNRAYHTTGLLLTGTTMVYVDALAWTTLAVRAGTTRGATPRGWSGRAGAAAKGEPASVMGWQFL